jgi:hypothetical protein
MSGPCWKGGTRSGVRLASIWNGPATTLGSDGAGGVAAGGGEQATKNTQRAALKPGMTFIFFGAELMHPGDSGCGRIACQSYPMDPHTLWKIDATRVHPDRDHRHALYPEHTLGHCRAAGSEVSGWDSRARRRNRSRITLQRRPTYGDCPWCADDGRDRHRRAGDCRERGRSQAARCEHRRGSRRHPIRHSPRHELLRDRHGVRRRQSQRRRADTVFVSRLGRLRH